MLEWFAASKAVRPDGAPLLVFHGTGWDFVPDGGLWFTPDPGMASWYATGRASAFGDEAAPNVVPGFLKLEYPLEVDAAGAPYDAIPFNGGVWLTDDLAGESQERGHDGLVLRNVRDGDDRLGDVYFAPAPQQFLSAFSLTAPAQAPMETSTLRDGAARQAPR